MTKSKQERRENKTQKTLPKIQPLPGSLCAQKVRCGKANCKCAKGELHEGYYYHFFYAGGKLHKRYVKKADVLNVKKATEINRQQQRQIRREVQEAMQAFHLMRSHLRDLHSEYGQ
jgi:hypothetical protein